MVDVVIAWARSHLFKTDCRQVLVEGNLRDYFKYPMIVCALVKDARQDVKTMKLLKKSMDGRGKRTRAEPLRIEERGCGVHED